MPTRLLNASFGVQALVAWGVLALLVVLVATNLLGLTTGIGESYATLTETRERVGKLTQFTAIDLSQFPEPSQSGDTINLFMPAPSLAIARANLQQRVTELATTSNVLIASAGNLPDLQENDATMIGLRVDFSGSYDNVARMVMALETATPPLILKELNVNVVGEDLPDRPPELSVQLRVYGAVRIDQVAPAEAAAGGGQ